MNLEDGNPAPPPPPHSTVDAAQQSAQNWALACHLAGFAMYTGIPFASVLGPFVVWQLKRDEHPLIDDQGKEAVNFQISIAIYTLVSFAMIFCFFIGVPMLAFLAVWHIVLMILAAIKSNQGHYYRYPLCLRLVH